MINEEFTFRDNSDISLTKRELFAAMTLQGLLANHKLIGSAELLAKYQNSIVSKSVNIADELIINQLTIKEG